jgi:hypothetical protein
LACYLHFDAASHEPVTVRYNGRGQAQRLAHVLRLPGTGQAGPPALLGAAAVIADPSMPTAGATAAMIT